MLNILVYAVGWILFVAGQAKNSVTSKTNGLPTGWPGIKAWLWMHDVDLMRRAFFSALAYGFIVHSITENLSRFGFPLSSHTVAGVAGFAANNLLYQFFGLFPGLRIEVGELAPPAPSSQNSNAPAPSQTKEQQP
jgi:hypothetical protein